MNILLVITFFLIISPSSTNAAGPAGIDSGLKLWFSATSGVQKTGGITAVDGDTVQTWLDQSADARTATRQSGGATYSTTGLNFNPTLSFSGSNYTFSDTGLPSGSADRSIFVVASTNDTGNWRYVLGAGTFGSNAGFDFGNRAGSGTVFITTHSAQEAQTGSWSPLGTARLAYGSVTSATLFLAVNGGTLSSGGSGVNTVLDGNANIGANSGGVEQWEGNISEVIMFNRTVSSEERQRINSYLALKYGFSLDQSTPQSYLASGSNLMWDKDAAGASTYNNGLFGIGRDDDSNLAQIKSRGQTSTNVIILEAQNEGSNGNASFNDIQNLEFLVIGDNNGSASWTTTGAPAGYSILSRQWKKQEQGDVGPVTMDFDVADSDFNIPAALDADKYYFIYDTDNDNSLADETPQSMSDQGSNLWRVTVDFGSGGLFSLASTVNPAVTMLSPADNATSIAVDSDLSVTFSQTVTIDSGNVELRKTSDDSLVESFSVGGGRVSGSGTNTITINPTNSLAGSTSYYVLIPNTAFVNSGNYFGGISSTLAWDFTTASVPTSIPTATPTPGSSGGTGEISSGSSESVAGSSTGICSAIRPASSPDLFQINVSATKATLFFTPLHSTVTNYYVAYGFSEGEERFGVFTNLGPSTGVLSYTINHLQPKKTYYFKILPYNQCAPGEWSNNMKIVTTANGASAVSVYKNFVSKILSYLPKQVTDIHSVDVKGVNAASKKTAVKEMKLSSKNSCEYTVQLNDTLWKIAKKKLGNGNRYTEIMQENNFTDPIVNPGMVLKIGCK